jgi:hypothetical protein
VQDAAPTFDELTTHFGALLGLDEAAPEDALRAAVDDPVYARHLMGSRGAPAAVRHLLRNPPRRAAAPAEPPSTAALTVRAAAALGRWAAAGFKTVDEPTLRRRREACLGCEHLADPPEKVLYQIAARGADDPRVCALCGCVAANKARLPGESCPAPHPSVPGLTRWGEPSRD